MRVTRPVLRWHGGKWQLADWVISFFPPHHVYTEVFGGAASVLLKKARVHSEIYNDLDAGVVNLFRVLRDPEKAERLAEQIRLTPFARGEFEAAYGPESPDEIERARILVVRSYMGFGSDSVNKARPTGFRVHATRGGTSPGGDWRNWPECIAAVVDRLRGVMVENKPAIEVLERFDAPETLHYVDPPYLAETRSVSPGVYAHEMNTEEQHRELAACLHKLKGYIILSGYQSTLYSTLYDYKGWERHTTAANTNMNIERTEAVWMNPRASDAFGQGKLF